MQVFQSKQANIPNKTEYLCFESGGEFHNFKRDYLKACNGRYLHSYN